MAAIRYLVKDVDRSIAFYTGLLGFKVAHLAAPSFASVSRDDLTLWLSGPQSSAARPMPDGRRPEPGGWNRLVLEVKVLSSRVAALKQAGGPFWNEIGVGAGGEEILAQQPHGNSVQG